jgi:hypothetical protein
MTKAMINIFTRVVRRRMADGEELENILASYPNLSESDKDKIRMAVQHHGKGSEANED